MKTPRVLCSISRPVGWTLAFPLIAWTLLSGEPLWGDNEKLAETGPDRAVLHTVAGDIALSFYPGVAPKNVAQVLKLMRLGVYDSTHFFRVEPNFVIQIANAQDRLVPLKPAQLSAITKLPLEVRADVRHHPWMLSMARQADDPNSAETSFSILLSDAPHLDGQYTIIGQVEKGFEVIHELLKVSRDTQSRPAARLSIHSVTVYDRPEDFAKATLAPPTPVKDPNSNSETKLAALRYVLSGGLIAILLLSVGGFLLFPKLSPTTDRSLHLLVVLIAVLLLLIVTQPLTLTLPFVGAAAFVALVSTFKLLGRFES